jgi:small-conductance mechanosensitive channel
MFEHPGDWALENGIRIGIILVLAIALHFFLRRVIPRAMALAMQPHQQVDNGASQRQRVDTISTVFVRTADMLIIVLASLLVLGEIGVSLAPFIAGAGVVGLAIGFGAQSLIRDTLAGAFIVIEDQFRTGDVVAIAGVEGTVEDITLRRTVLRDLNGVLHSVPNSEITVASNQTRGWAGINLIVGIGYGEDVDAVKETVDGVGRELADDPAWQNDIVKAPSVARVDSLGDSSVDLRVLGRTAPGRQWAVTGELRRRIKLAFDKAGIEIPFPHRVIISRPAEDTRRDATD